MAQKTDYNEMLDTSMSRLSIINKAAGIITADELVKKHKAKFGWVSGSTTEVAPVTCWVESGQVEIQLDTNRNVFHRCITRIIKASNGLITDGYFIKNDGSCPSELKFVVDYSAAQTA